MADCRKEKNKVGAAVTGILIALTLAFIWGNSCLSVSASGKESEGIFEKIKPVFNFLFGEGVITHSLFRKMAHAGEFFLLGAEICLLYIFLGAFNKNKVFEIMFLGLFCACFDESIQILSERGSSVKDVLIDFSGFTAAVLCFVLYLIIFKLSFVYINNKKVNKE